MPKKPQTELIKQYFEFALGIMLTTAFTVLKLPRFGELYKVDPVHAILSIVLFVVTFAFFAGWIYFDHREIQLMETYIDTEISTGERLLLPGRQDLPILCFRFELNQNILNLVVTDKMGTPVQKFEIIEENEVEVMIEFRPFFSLSVTIC